MQSETNVSFFFFFQAKYMFDIYCKLNVGAPVLCLHGGMNQLRRLAVYDIFCQKENVVLFATDLASRGLGKVILLKDILGYFSVPSCMHYPLWFCFTFLLKCLHKHMYIIVIDRKG